MDDAQLQTVWQQRQMADHIVPLGQPLAMLVKHQLERRVHQLQPLAAAWDEVVPDAIAEHTALEGFSRGVLTVMVDTAAHRFQLENLLRGGLLGMLRQRFAGVLQKVRVVPGQFCSLDLDGRPRYGF